MRAQNKAGKARSAREVTLRSIVRDPGSILKIQMRLVLETDRKDPPGQENRLQASKEAGGEVRRPGQVESQRAVEER